MKDEYGGAIIDQFIGLKSKMYSIKKKKNGSESGTAKGVNIATVSIKKRKFKLSSIVIEVIKIVFFYEEILSI